MPVTGWLTYIFANYYLSDTDVYSILLNLYCIFLMYSKITFWNIVISSSCGIGMQFCNLQILYSMSQQCIFIFAL